ncbi:MAG: hydantoinase/oxoprolinase family protein, partial [Hyphomicrobiales bacterium]|nr:hydantoinase/oxoprolinase family protein [Hyphomicrobiales bacterium]
GPVHAAQVAEDLGIPRVLVPLNPGAFSALGLLCTDVRHDYMRSEMSDVATLSPAHAEACFDDLVQAAKAEIAAEGLRPQDAIFAREVDLRYSGQGYELRVGLDGLAAPLDRTALDALGERFHDQHAALHGHSARDTAIEVVSYRVRASVVMPKYKAMEETAADTTQAVPTGKRMLVLGPARKVEAALWRRESLQPGWRASGPAIIEQVDATTIVPDGWDIRCDHYRNLILERARR